MEVPEMLAVTIYRSRYEASVSTASPLTSADMAHVADNYDAFDGGHKSFEAPTARP
jgi:hypothetical protein